MMLWALQDTLTTGNPAHSAVMLTRAIDLCHLIFHLKLLRSTNRRHHGPFRALLEMTADNDFIQNLVSLWNRNE